MEEIIKFIFFVFAILLLKPATTRRVLFTGMLIGAGFATVEHFSNEIFSWQIFPLRLVGHMLFTTVIALWYSLGSFARMRWIDDGAKAGIVPFLLSRCSQSVMVLWVVAGIFLAAFFHSFVNLYASSGHYMAVIIEAIGCIIVSFFFLNQKSKRPYGRILQEIKLMQDIHDIQETLINLQHPINTYPETKDDSGGHFEIKKIRLSRKQFAKK
jgi:hypothetical protein